MPVAPPDCAILTTAHQTKTSARGRIKFGMSGMCAGLQQCSYHRISIVSAEFSSVKVEGDFLALRVDWKKDMLGHLLNCTNFY